MAQLVLTRHQQQQQQQMQAACQATVLLLLLFSRRVPRQSAVTVPVCLVITAGRSWLLW
jgi:hypothetical protein